MAAALSEPTAASLTLTGSSPVVDAGSVHVSSGVAIVATVNDDPEVRISSLAPLIGLVGDPADVVTLLTGSVATVNEDPVIRITDISISVLRNPFVYRSFRAVWVE
jgi:hypothetical protein